MYLNQCYEYCFGTRFGLFIESKYFGTSLFRRTISNCFRFSYIYVYIRNFINILENFPKDNK